MHTDDSQISGKALASLQLDLHWMSTQAAGTGRALWCLATHGNAALPMICEHRAQAGRLCRQPQIVNIAAQQANMQTGYCDKEPCQKGTDSTMTACGDLDKLVCLATFTMNACVRPPTAVSNAYCCCAKLGNYCLAEKCHRIARQCVSCMLLP